MKRKIRGVLTVIGAAMVLDYIDRVIVAWVQLILEPMIRARMKMASRACLDTVAADLHIPIQSLSQNNERLLRFLRLRGALRVARVFRQVGLRNRNCLE